MAKTRAPAPTERIAGAICIVRGRKVLLDADLATPYAVTTRVLVQAVKRNPDRFPADFIFRLTKQEAAALRSQSVSANGEAAVARKRLRPGDEQKLAEASSRG